jgi:nucleoside phosphorylase
MHLADLSDFQTEFSVHSVEDVGQRLNLAISPRSPALIMDPSEYTIGWIAPLPLELAIAKVMMDETHDRISDGEYTYSCGRIGLHNVVIAPQAYLGITHASKLADRMKNKFKNLRFFLVVGIGGGVPSYGRPGAKEQIVLGDVVVSYPRGNHGGVVQYAKGAWTGAGKLETSGHTNKPPDMLLQIVADLRSEHLNSPSKAPEILQEARNKLTPLERTKYEDPGETMDSLFNDDYEHSSRDLDCDSCCDHTQSKTRSDRGPSAGRQPDCPQIHYGNIACSDQLQISAMKRNECQKEFQVICFEMEGAGVIDSHPGLVIRGICDYSNSHKNKMWQNYAAATAAAYAKELLLKVPTSKRISRGTSSLH